MNDSFHYHNAPPKHFTPASFLDFEQETSFPFVLLVLNTPITRGDLYEKCASRAMAIMAADGGGNQIFDYVQETQMPNLMNQLRPECIIGDLDSLRPETEQFFRQRGTTIVRIVDPYSTDFTKALRHITNQTQWLLNSFNARTGRQEQSLKVLIFGGLGGRADQAFSQIHHLYVAAQDPYFNQLDLYLLTGDSIMFLLKQGQNVIDTPLTHLGENVGIIPVGRPARITICGFEWDVVDWETSFGTQLSTSNHIRAPQVSVATTERMLFTVEIPPSDQPSRAQRAASNIFDGDGSNTQTDAANSNVPSMWQWT